MTFVYNFAAPLEILQGQMGPVKLWFVDHVVPPSCLQGIDSQFPDSMTCKNIPFQTVNECRVAATIQIPNQTVIQITNIVQAESATAEHGGLRGHRASTPTSNNG